MDSKVIELINELVPKMTEKEKLAFMLAFGAHTSQDQRDQVGLEYIAHPLIVFRACDSEETRIVALLHDVVEDTSIKARDLEMFFSKEIVEAIKLLSHPKDNFDYDRYLENIKANPIARKVKLEDLRTNMDKSRLDSLEKWIDMKIEKKYKPAFDYLNK